MGNDYLDNVRLYPACTLSARCLLQSLGFMQERKVILLLIIETRRTAVFTLAYTASYTYDQNL